jgi:hypothetical protein
MARTRTTNLATYRGPARLVNAEGERTDVQVVLRLRQTEHASGSYEHREWSLGDTDWYGTVTTGLAAGSYVLEMPDGRTGEALIANGKGSLHGSGVSPFGTAEPPGDGVGAPPADGVGAPPADGVGAPPADSVGAPPADDVGAPPA